MKRILVWGLSNNRAGTEAVISAYIKAADKQKYCFDFLCYDEPSNYAELFSKDGLNRVFQLPVKIQHPIAHHRALKHFMNDHAREYYAVWFNANDISNIDLLLSAKKHGIKHRILHSHNGNIPKRLVTRIFSHLNINKMKHVVTDRWACSRAAGDFMFCGEPYEIIPNLVDAKKFAFSQDARTKIRGEYDWEDNFVVGTIGRLSEQKNQLFLLELMPALLERIPSLKVVIIGEGEFKEALIAKAEELDLKGHFQLLSPKDNISEILSAFDCFVFPSLYEGLSLAALEAQFNGLPCVMSEGVSRETEISKATEFVSLLEPNKWVNAIAKAKRIDDPLISEKASVFDSAHIAAVADHMFEFK